MFYTAFVFIMVKYSAKRLNVARIGGIPPVGPQGFILADCGPARKVVRRLRHILMGGVDGNEKG
jgi:hypothetical protein